MFYYFKSFAKLNLNLSVSPLIKETGLHRISSIFQTISFSDEIYIRPKVLKGLTITCNDSTYPCNEANILYKVYDSFSKYLKVGFEIYVHKHIPIGSGLGAGSSQAALFLNFLNMYCKCSLSHKELINLAASYGSDVPFFIKGGQALVEGYGEVINEYNFFNNYVSYLLVLPFFSLSTKDVYNKFDSLPNKHVFLSARNQKIGQNDLLKPVLDLMPSMQNVIDICHDLKINLFLSGSGSTMFIPFQCLNLAHATYKSLSKFSNLFSLFFSYPVNSAYARL